MPDPTKSSAATAVPYQPTVAPYASFGTAAALGTFPRTIKHAMGDASLKTAPQRVVVLDTAEMDSVVELGLKPVGAIDWTGSGFPQYLKEGMAGVKAVGSIAEPNIEAIAGLAPDLILSNRQRHEKVYDKLAAIGPTVFGAPRTTVAWKQSFELVARSLGREEQAAQTVARYEARVRQFNAALTGKRPTISVVRVFAQGLYYYQRTNFLGLVLTDLGLPRPDAQNVDDFAVGYLPLETLREYAPADLVVVSVFPGAEEAYKTMQESPLWKGLDPVKTGSVLVVDDIVWIAGLGYRAANQVIDDLAKHFKLALR